MKKLQLIVLLMLLFCEAGFSQADRYKVLALEASTVQSDSTNFSPIKVFEKRIKLKPINESENRIEIRFYELESANNTRDLTVLELQNDTWKGTHYSESNLPESKVKKFGLEADKGFAEVVQMLIDNNLTKLPSQEELKPKMKKYAAVADKRGRAEQVVFVMDGYSYTVEFKIGGKHRIYSFNNPEAYADFYADVQELKDYVAIKNIFATELKRK